MQETEQTHVSSCFAQL